MVLYIDVIYCKNEEQTADIITKPVKTAMFEKLQSMLRVCSRKEVIHDGWNLVDEIPSAHKLMFAARPSV